MKSQEEGMESGYYLQDSRSYVGNDVLWWAQDSNGYTTDLSNAHVFTQEEAVRHHESRNTDIPWPKAYIDARTRPAVDMQYINREDALKGTGISIKKPKKETRRYNCTGCGRFVTAAQFYTGCPHCETSY